jgi:hypothetical protein
MQSDWTFILQVVQIGGSFVGMITAIGAVFYTSGKNKQKIEDLKESHGQCRILREKNECDLFERVSEVEEGLAYQKGLRNGAKS